MYNHTRSSAVVVAANNANANKNTVTPVSGNITNEVNMKEMIEKAREVLGTVDETKFKKLLSEHNNNIDETILAMLSGA